MAGFLASPRRRRRLIRISAVLGFAVVIAVLTVVLPSHAVRRGHRAGSEGLPRSRRTPLRTRRPSAPESPPRWRRRRWPRSSIGIAGRSNLSRAYDLLAPALRKRYERDAWLRGEDLPFAPMPLIGTTRPAVAFSGPDRVGFVITSRRGSDVSLAAIRFAKVGGSWRVDYVKEGRGSSSRQALIRTPAPQVRGRPARRGA